MKLPRRLNSLLKMINRPYEHIWDCCCDHGYLGQVVLMDRLSTVVHFLDVVEEIVDKVEQKVAKMEIDSSCWEMHCKDLHELVLPPSANAQLLIIAGVGGDLTADMVSAVLRNNPDKKIDFLLCPVRKVHKVRVKMEQLGLGLIDELIVKDAGLFYEVMYLSTESEEVIRSVGGKMWDLTQTEHCEYLHQNIKHYERMSSQPNGYAQEVLASYLALKSVK